MLWFGADLDPDAKQVWFRVASEDIRRIRAETPRTRGYRVIDAPLSPEVVRAISAAGCPG